MNQSTTDRNGQSNGKAVAEILKAEVLSYPNARISPFHRGCVNSAAAIADQQAIDFTKEQIWPRLVDRIKSLKSVTLSLGNLDPETMAETLVNQLQASSILAQPINDYMELGSRQQLIKKLATKRGLDHFAEEATVVDEHVEAVFEELTEQITRVADVSPLKLADTCTEVRECINTFQIAHSEFEHTRKFANIYEFSTTIRRDSNAVPPHKVDELQSSLNQKATELASHVLREVIYKFIAPAVASHVTKLKSFLAKIRKRKGGQVLNQATQLLFDKLEHKPKLRTSVLSLNGPTKQQVLNELASRFNCDVLDLATEMSAQLLETAHAAVIKAGFVDAEAEWGVVLEHWSAEQLVDAFSAMIENAKDSFSVYSAIESFGIDEAAFELKRLAQPFTHLNRNHIVFNVEITETAVLYVPKPLSESEQEILNQLREKLEVGFLGSLKLVVQEKGNGEIRLVRCMAGFSAAIESLNQDLFEVYVESKDSGHCCHLFAVIPDSTDGLPSLIAIELYNVLYPNGEKNDA